jgi:phosphate transport system substrate-binding protein
MSKFTSLVLGLAVATLAAVPAYSAAPAATSPVTKKITWAGCGISKNAFMGEMAQAFEKKTGVKIDLVGGGATKGIRQVSSKEVNIGGTCRHVIEKDNSLTHDQERRVQLTPVAWDALAVIVHKDNPAKNISMQQMRDLFEGKITNWKQLGGKDAPVELYVRKGKVSGVGRTLRELVFHDYEKEFVAKHIMDSSGPLERAITENPNGIGVTGVSSARKAKVKLLALDGKEPTYEHIKSGQYLLYRPLYVVTSMDERNPDIKSFVHFVRSDEGKAIMRKVGTVPYEDAINLWLTYLDQQNKAMANRLQVDERTLKKSAKR